MRFPPPLVAVLVLLALLAAGCARKSTPADDAAAKGILLFGNGTEVQDLDSQLVTGVPEHHVLLALTEGLLASDPADLHPLPGVAERWETSADGLTLTFHLRADARWSDGHPLTADDFIQSYRRMLTASLGAEYANMLYDYVEGAEDFHRGVTTDFALVGFRAPDPRTLVVKLRSPTPHLLGLIASHYSWNPVPIHVISRLGGLTTRGSGWTRPENFVGNGPFRLREWRRNQVLIVERNPHYWDRDAVKLNEIHFFTIEDSEAEERLFRAGQLHITNSMPHSKIDAYRRERPDVLRIAPFLGAYFYRCNVTRPPLNDVRVRRALALALDRETIVTHITRGGQTPAYQLTPPGLAGYEPRARLRGTLDDARRLLAEAGYPEGRGLPPVEILFNNLDNHRAIAEAVQRMWRVGLGIEVSLKSQEWKVYLDSMDTLAYSLARSGWIGDCADPNAFLEIFVTAGGNNDTGWSNAEYDRLRAESLRATDSSARLALFQRMEEILVEEVPVIPIYHYSSVHLIDTRVQGHFPNPLDNHPFKTMSLEKSR